MTDGSLAARDYETSGDINIRTEMNQFLYGGDSEPIRGQLGLVWVADPTKRLASFKQKAAHYPETSPSSDYLKSGFIHTEYELNIWLGFTGGQGVSYPMGKIDAGTTFIYLEYDAFPSIRVATLSEIWTLVLDNDGTPVRRDSEYIKDIRWAVRQAYPFREAEGRLQYWRCHCERQNI